jgi:hypothetical protein
VTLDSKDINTLVELFELLIQIEKEATRGV